MARSLARAADGVLHLPDATAAPLLLDSPDWYAWLEHHTSFAFVDPHGTLTVRKERRRPGGWYWQGYRRQAGKVRTAYLGRSPDLTLARLRAAAQALAGGRLASLADSGDPVPAPRPVEQDALPQTKFFMPPPRPQRVQRARLLDRLRADPLPPVTLVAAPAGCGKTSLVADWITADQ